MPKPKKTRGSKQVKTAVVMVEYAERLDRQSLAARSRDAYRSQVGRFLDWLATAEHGAEALSRVWRIDRSANYGQLDGLARNRINTKPVTTQWCGTVPPR